MADWPLRSHETHLMSHCKFLETGLEHLRKPGESFSPQIGFKRTNSPCYSLFACKICCCAIHLAMNIYGERFSLRTVRSLVNLLFVAVDRTRPLCLVLLNVDIMAYAVLDNNDCLCKRI